MTPSPSVGETCIYRCTLCGIAAESAPIRPPPALAVFGLPIGWLLVPVVEHDRDDALLCGGCQRRGPCPDCAGAGKRIMSATSIGGMAFQLFVASPDGTRALSCSTCAATGREPFRSKS